MNDGTHTKQLRRVALAAEAENSWRPLGVVFTTADEDEGVILFLHLASGTGDYTARGTAHFFTDAERVVFQWGHYELGEGSALTDYAERIAKNR